ncbi:MAG: hypothetical protein K2X27_13290 [Candidatus Obscuribacterales bacterium]|nr:hypothetical protein [Candidatus Obscuribacterales bacterium]
MFRYRKELSAALTAVLALLLGLPSLKLLYLYLGPPIVNLSTDPRLEFRSLDSAYKHDLFTADKNFKELSRLGLMQLPALRATAIFFLQPNKSKYSECYLELGRHYLQDADLAKPALLRAIFLDQGWNGQQAAGLFSSYFSNERAEAIQFCKLINNFETAFALKQLNSLEKQSHDPEVRACANLALGLNCQARKQNQEANKWLERAAAFMSIVEENDLLDERGELQSALELAGKTNDATASGIRRKRTSSPEDFKRESKEGL